MLGGLRRASLGVRLRRGPARPASLTNSTTCVLQGLDALDGHRGEADADVSGVTGVGRHLVERWAASTSSSFGKSNLGRSHFGSSKLGSSNLGSSNLGSSNLGQIDVAEVEGVGGGGHDGLLGGGDPFCALHYIAAALTIASTVPQHGPRSGAGLPHEAAPIASHLRGNRRPARALRWSRSSLSTARDPGSTRSLASLAAQDYPNLNTLFLLTTSVGADTGAADVRRAHLRSAARRLRPRARRQPRLRRRRQRGAAARRRRERVLLLLPRRRRARPRRRPAARRGAVPVERRRRRSEARHLGRSRRPPARRARSRPLRRGRSDHRAGRVRPGAARRRPRRLRPAVGLPARARRPVPGARRLRPVDLVPRRRHRPLLADPPAAARASWSCRRPASATGRSSRCAGPTSTTTCCVPATGCAPSSR